MKKLLLILFCLPLLFTTCKKEDDEPTNSGNNNTGNNVNTPTHTYVPDDNFENYLEANDMGDGIALNDSVLTANIIDVNYLNISPLNSSADFITDLTGIEDFTALTSLRCSGNGLQFINLINATNLRNLDCAENQLKSLDLSNISDIAFSGVQGNGDELICFGNPDLTCINVKNGVNTDNWGTWMDPNHYFSTNCPPYVPQVDVYGCIDIDATNYNPLANIDDGSCQYLSVSVGDFHNGGVVFYLKNGSQGQHGWYVI